MLCAPLRYVALLLTLLMTVPLRAGAAPPESLHWIRLPVTRALPSQVFARLGIGHITRRGYTRDGAKKTDPDPTFPLGLTDVVPLDAEHLLLVRGTNAGLAAFKVKVAQAQAQVIAVRWQVTAQLVQSRGDTVILLGPPAVQNAPDSAPVTFLLGTNGDLPYQVSVLPNVQHLLKIVWQRGLILSRPAPSPHVLAPDIAWSVGVSRTIPQGGSVTFDDLAADRLIAREALGLPADTQNGDYGVRISVSLLAPPAPDIPLPLSPAPETPQPVLGT